MLHFRAWSVLWRVPSSLFASAPSSPATHHPLRQVCPCLLHSYPLPFLSLPSFMQTWLVWHLCAFPALQPPTRGSCTALPKPILSLQALPPSPTPQNPPLCSVALYVQNGLPRTFIHLLTMLPQIISPEGLPSLQASPLLCLQVTLSAVPALFVAIPFCPWRILFGALIFFWILSLQK